MVTKSQDSSARVRVLIADADAMGGQLIASALKRCRDQFIVVGLASTEQEVLNYAHGDKPDVVVLGTALDEGPGSGLAVLEKMRAKQPEVKCVVLLHSFDRDLVLESFRNGARGIFSRRGPFKSLAKCIRCVHDGQIWANNEQIEYILEAFAPIRPQLIKRNGMSLLTPREQAVTALVAEGMKNREIAHELQVTDHTVSNYLYHIFDKLGVSSRVELILYALSQDIVSPAQKPASSIMKPPSTESCRL